jgi:UPF0716 protein FxsA
VPLLILALVIGIPLLELAVLIWVGGRIGVFPTIALVIATAVIGVTLVRLQGLAAIARAQAYLAANRFPAGEVFDGFFLLLAGGFLLVPGFITDAVGLLLLVPPLRRALGRLIWRGVFARGTVRTWATHYDFGADEVVIEGEFEEVDETQKKEEEGKDRKPPTLPPPGAPKR